MKKKLLLFIMVFLLLPLTATAYDFEVDGIYYNIDGSNAIVTCRGSDPMDNNEYSGHVIIPSTVTFGGTTYSVTSIVQAFSYCEDLISISIPNSVTYISAWAFSFCSSLTSIYVENGNTKYDSRDNCNAIIETSSNSLIAGCMNTIIPNSVTSICNGAFYGISGLTNIVIPNTVTSIGEGAFSCCSGLTSIIIPHSVTVINEFTFSGCSALTSVVLPGSVASISNESFSECRCLAEISVLALSPPIVSSTAFTGCYGATLYVPDIAVENYKAANNWKEFTNIVGMPYTFMVDGISYRATTMNTAKVIAKEGKENYYTGDVVIPESVTYEDQTFVVTGIEENAFDGCYELSSVVIPNSVETIGEQAFQGCTGMKSITIGYDVSAIGAKAFNYCNALEKVTCLGVVPPVMASIDCFSNAAYNHSKLIVPRNSQESYLSVNYWYKFANIDGWGSAGPGDIDSDGFVSISDVTALIDALLSGDLESIYFDSADLNGNGRLDIGDVTSLIDNLLNSK